MADKMTNKKKIINLGFPSRRSEKFNKLSCTSNDFFKVSGGCSLCLSVCLASHEQYFSYLATVTNAWDRAANLDLCLALTTFNSEDSFTCHTYCDTGPPFLRSYPKDLWFYLLNAMPLANEQLLPILNVLGLERLVRARLELTASHLLSESTTTRLHIRCSHHWWQGVQL